MEKSSLRKPAWLLKSLSCCGSYLSVEKTVASCGLNTVCVEATCPNIFECFSRNTATFMILGNVCTRNCLYCGVKHGKPSPLDAGEPERLAKAVKKLGLKYVVVTSVTRDDLPDGGAQLFADAITAVRELNFGCRVEVLVPDFNGSIRSLEKVVSSKPDVLGHNIEVVERLFNVVRPQGSYARSLRLLRSAKEFDGRLTTKSGLMLGLGESKEEVLRTLADLRDARVDVITLGQYLQPSERHVRVERYYSPEEFAELKDSACGLGFAHVESGPLVRSSYMAHEALRKIRCGSGL